MERWRISLLYLMGVRKVLEVQSNLVKVTTEKNIFNLKTQLS